LNELHVLIGLPGSGKSTYGKKLTEAIDGMYLSSDELREELFGNVNDQENNAKLFHEMNDRANRELNKGNKVIYDATNLSRKRRMHLINHELNGHRNSAHYISAHILDIKSRDANRERTVGESVIDRMYKSLQIPTINEGWDSVIVELMDPLLISYRAEVEEKILEGISHDQLFNSVLATYFPDFKEIIDVAHDSTFHSFSISRHIYYTYRYLLDHYEGSHKLELLWAGLFHDLGKGFCKSFVNYKGKPLRYAHFVGQENVSAQLACYWLNRLGYEKEFVLRVVDLVQFHMLPINATESKIEELGSLLGEENFHLLMLLHEADIQAT
jgi:predicted kinase